MSSSDSTALILVDVTNSFYLKGMPNFYLDAEKTLEPLRRLLEAAAPVSASWCTPPSSTARDSMIMNGRSCRSITLSVNPMRLSPLGLARMGPREFLLPKRRYSAFFATDLALFLHEQKIERVVVAGVKTNVCIRATVQDAFANGFEVIVPREATNSNRPHLAEASLEDIDRYLARS